MKSFGILALALLATVALADIEIEIYKQSCIDVPKARQIAIEKGTGDCKNIKAETVDENAKFTLYADMTKNTGPIYEAMKKGYMCYFTAAGARDESGNTKLPEAREALVAVAKEGKGDLLGKAFDDCVKDAGLESTGVLLKDKRPAFIGCMVGKVAEQCMPAGE